MSSRADGGPPKGVREWLVALAFAVPVTAGLVCLFYNWYAVLDRYFIFLYYHEMGTVFDTSPFGWVTVGRYRMSALVASGAVMVPYLAVNFILGRIARRYRAPVWWRVWVLCAVPLAVAIPAILMTVNNPVLSLSLAIQVTVVLHVGLALALVLGRAAAERPWTTVLALIDGGALASLLVSLPVFERYPGWLARGRGEFVVAHLAWMAASIALLAGMTAVYHWWRRAQMAGLWVQGAAGLDIAYLFMPLVHHLAFSTDSGLSLGVDDSRYITSADNYFARSAWVQVGVWLAVGLIVWGFNRLRVSLLGRRKAG